MEKMCRGRRWIGGDPRETQTETNESREGREMGGLRVVNFCNSNVDDVTRGNQLSPVQFCTVLRTANDKWSNTTFSHTRRLALYFSRASPF